MTGRRGRLRVLLGAAPGVGTTCAMLEEAHRLLAEGRDVVLGVVETHGREATEALAAGIPRVAAATEAPHGAAAAGPDRLDLDAVLARAPQVVLVDELARANPAGARHARRWGDAEELLEAGIDVVSTVRVEQIASLDDVARRITGVPQDGTVPDRVLREADQVEVVDLAPASLRERLAAGLIYPAERVDAAVASYFRLGTLTALRELALLWLADDVEQALRDYRSEHGIEEDWGTRERVVVALPGGPEGEALLRRGARIAARSGGGELLAVHVAGQAAPGPGAPADRAAQRALAEQLGGTYHQVLGEDVPRALVGFARSVGATQLVLGAGRRGRWATRLTGRDVGTAVIGESAEIDVHIVPRAAAGGRSALPRSRSALTARRRLAGLAIALLGGPLLMWLLAPLRDPGSIATAVLSYQLLVVVVALVGGLWPALFAALLSGITLDLFFVEPHLTVAVADPVHLAALLLHVVIAALVSYVVDRAARQTQKARRAAAESELIQAVAGSVLGGRDEVRALVEQTREAFSLDAVRLVRGGETLAVAGVPGAQDAPGRIAVGHDAVLELHGEGLPASEQRLLPVVATQLAAALEHRRLVETAREAETIAASDRVRGALLSALSHDLRRPLAAAATAVGGLRAAGDALSPADQRELLDTAEESLGSLGALLTDLLDVSRLQADALTIASTPLDPADALLPALEELGLAPDDVVLSLEHGSAQVLADPILLQRAAVNVLANALRYAPPGTPVRIATSAFEGRVEIRVVDHGPGIPPERRDDVFRPFQRLGDTDNSTGLGLGLALSRGFAEAMRGTLEPEDTPGGGLTMVLSLPAEPDPGDVAAVTKTAERAMERREP